MQLELLSSGHGLVEGPRTDAANNLYFTDLYLDEPSRGSVYRLGHDGVLQQLVERGMVGGLAVHADGGLVLSGATVVHWRDGIERELLRREGVTFFNDMQPDRDGNLYVGSNRWNLSDMSSPQPPGEMYRIAPGGTVTELYGEVQGTNGIGLSPDGTTLYHVDSGTRGLWVHDVGADGSVSNRRHIGHDVFEPGIPDGMCVDADGNLWVAHVLGQRVVKLSPSGDVLDEIPVPAQSVTSAAFGGPDWDDLYIVTADNLDDPALGGCVFRCRPGVAGVPTPLTTV